ncbi:hypothetical protein EVG20_g5395 [Dentipellis fragilis]|uniref:DUF6533 domain-containing protein n=1 Tax=Dentipellis fragilis TaxID=205917 RepID=A0A4Y9YTE6_9AGAM|nr:hypothetical protein EVG20_g5395 [Dentipellis fragilis]
MVRARGPQTPRRFPHRLRVHLQVSMMFSTFGKLRIASTIDHCPVVYDSTTLIFMTTSTHISITSTVGSNAHLLGNRGTSATVLRGSGALWDAVKLLRSMNDLSSRLLRPPTPNPTNRSMDAAAANRIVVALQQNRIVTYFDLNAGVLLLYDHFLTLPDEIDMIWRSDWNIIKVVFLLSRYIAICNTGIGFYHQFGYSLSNSICSDLHTTNGWLIMCNIGMSEIVLIYRTYAVWGKRKSFAYALGLLLCAALIIQIVYVEKALRTMETLPISSILPESQGCFVLRMDKILFVGWSSILGVETIIVGLTFIKALQELRHVSSPLLNLIFRDSALAYTALLVSSVANVLVILLGQPGSTYLLSGTQHALHVVLISRIVLNIRRSALCGAVASNMEEIELQQTVSAFEAAPGP